ncbi:MAG: PLP-dependent aminotransferase family protein [Pseudomonadales bacterium]|nr:PLP-dependent aminotransferase family protein [Pseudomonadales bacterium]
MNKQSSLNLEIKTNDSVMYRNLYQQIRDQILNGFLAPRARLPSTRSLAAELGCSRGTIERAYDMLLSEGYIHGAGAAGTRVNPNLDPKLIAAGVLGTDGKPVNGTTHQSQETPPLSLQLGLPALNAFPRKLWSRLINKHMRNMGAHQFARGNAFGYFPLRQAIANYLAISRGVNTEPEQIFITSGFQGALSTIVQCLSSAEDQIWCEDPGYFRARDCLNQLGVPVIPVPVDENGLQVSLGIKMADKAKFALITPTHQSPMGVTLSLARRMELLHWAATQGSWIIEDDYDSEFRYGEKPLPALKSLDANNRVIYVGSFSKVLIPSLRLGYIVVPKPLQIRFEESLSSLWSVGSLLEQKVVTEFMAEGHFSLHIKKMRSLYAERRAALASALQKRLAGEMTLSLQVGGMHLIAELKNVKDEKRLQQKALELGIALHFLSHFLIKVTCPPTLLLSFTNVDVADAERVVGLLAQAIEACTKN